MPKRLTCRAKRQGGTSEDRATRREPLRARRIVKKRLDTCKRSRPARAVRPHTAWRRPRRSEKSALNTRHGCEASYLKTPAACSYSSTRLTLRTVRCAASGSNANWRRTTTLHAKNRIATHLVQIRREQLVMKALDPPGRSGRAATHHARQGGVCQQPAPQHYVARLRIRRAQGVIFVHAKNVAVVRHGERRAAQRLAIGLLARGSLVAVLLHARMDDELCQGQAAVQIEDLPVLPVFDESQPGFDGDGYGRALAHVLQERLQLAGVAQKARSAALRHHRSGRHPRLRLTSV